MTFASVLGGIMPMGNIKSTDDLNNIFTTCVYNGGNVAPANKPTSSSNYFCLITIMNSNASLHSAIQFFVDFISSPKLYARWYDKLNQRWNEWVTL
jgi:hypothetical protein